jgi:membrane protease YdiL (CAAX protease family)
MKTAMEFLRRRSLVIGILLMFALTWPIDLAYAGVLPFRVPFLLYLFLGWGFGIASVSMTWLTAGKAGVIALLKRYLHWRVGWKWYLAAIFLGPVLIAGGVYLHAALTGVAPDFSTIMAYKIFGESAAVAPLLLFVLPFFVIDFIANGEEIGWRGYVLPRLQAKYSALGASLIVGVVWGFWHLPKYLTHWNTISFLWFMAHTLSAAFIYTWLYNGTRGSLLLVTIFHASVNTAGVFMPMANTLGDASMGAYIMYVLLEALVAVVLLRLTGLEQPLGTEPVQIHASPSTVPNQIS